jgi:hypothetical protein
VVFFTKNGRNLGELVVEITVMIKTFLLGDAFENVVGSYYPVVGMHTPGAHVRVSSNNVVRIDLLLKNLFR